MSDFYVRKVSQTCDEGTSSWFDTYEVPGAEGQPITVHVPREERSPGAIRRHLLRAGADIPGDAGWEEAIARATEDEAPVSHRVPHVGWRDDLSAFVTHYNVYARAGTTLLVPPVDSSMAIAPPPAQGSLADWRLTIKGAVFSTAMIVALCTVFAAALIRPLRRQSFGLVFVGPSRSGKSTAQLVAGSALGFSTEETMPSLNGTASGLLAAAIAFSDHAMPINEVGSAKGRKCDVYDVVRETTYALLNGRDRTRHPSWTGVVNSTTHTFRILVLLSSEHSPDEWAARVGEFRDEGETARLIGVPVVAKGRKTVFDRAPERLQGHALQAWEGERLKELIEGVANHHGVAFPIFVQDLVAHQAVRIAAAERWMKLFQRRARKMARSRVALDIVAKFSLVLAGGMLAIDAGVLPFDRDEVGNAVWRACRAALKALPDAERDLATDLDGLKERLEAGSIVDLASVLRKERQLIGQADGFRRSKRGGSEYVVRAQVFYSWFRDDARLRQVLEWLDASGFLDHAKGAKPGRSNSWAQQQVTWPDETRQRSIVIYLPNGLSDLSLA